MPLLLWWGECMVTSHDKQDMFQDLIWVIHRHALTQDAPLMPAMTDSQHAMLAQKHSRAFTYAPAGS